MQPLWGAGFLLRNNPFVHCEDLSLGLAVTSRPGEENGAEHCGVNGGS